MASATEASPPDVDVEVVEQSQQRRFEQLGELRQRAWALELVDDEDRLEDEALLMRAMEVARLSDRVSDSVLEVDIDRNTGQLMRMTQAIRARADEFFEGRNEHVRGELVQELPLLIVTIRRLASAVLREVAEHSDEDHEHACNAARTLAVGVLEEIESEIQLGPPHQAYELLIDIVTGGRIDEARDAEAFHAAFQRLLQLQPRMAGALADVSNVSAACRPARLGSPPTGSATPRSADGQP